MEHGCERRWREDTERGNRVSGPLHAATASPSPPRKASGAQAIAPPSHSWLCLPLPFWGSLLLGPGSQNDDCLHALSLEGSLKQ